MRRISRRKVKGFTLIEVLLVAGILALLAAFAIPRLYQKAQEARIELAKAAVGRNGPIAKALESYKWDVGKYPDTDEGLAAIVAPKTSRGDEKYKGPYLEQRIDELKDPWLNPFEYRAPGQFNEESYDLWSRGPDGNDDGGKEGSDDIKNWTEK
jgi:general secretion pathway protein G